MTRTVTKSHMIITYIENKRDTLIELKTHYRDNFSLFELVYLEKAIDCLDNIIQSSDARENIIEECD